MVNKKKQEAIRILDDDVDYSERINEKTKDMTFEERQEFINDNWVKFIGYYRRNIDAFVIDILKFPLYPFQRYMLRAMAKGDFSAMAACRGLTKSFISAIFFVASAILYPGIKCGIASGKGQQARNVLIQKINGELVKNPNIRREITDVKTSPTNCVALLGNGSEIRAIVLGTKNGDSARSWRFNYLLVDEARLVSDDVINEVLIPMTKTRRIAALRHGKAESGKVIFISSAYLKTSDLYTRFRDYYEKMMQGNSRYFVCALSWEVGVDAGLFSKQDIEDAENDPKMTKEAFKYEYCAIFVGSSGKSFYPYELTNPLRTLNKPEFKQPKGNLGKYIITHDVAISGGRFADNAITHVIKLEPISSSGLYRKNVVYTKPHFATSLQGQADFIRELYHVKFPNTCAISVDARGNGQPLPEMLAQNFVYESENGDTTEFPPLVLVDDEEEQELEGAIPIVHAIVGTASRNNSMYTFAKVAAENKTLRLLKQSIDVADEYNANKITADEYAQYLEADRLQVELSNIKQDRTDGGTVIYSRIEKATKRDRATSLIYGLSVINEMEQENRKNLHTKHYDYNDYIYVPREKLSKIKHRKSKSHY